MKTTLHTDYLGNLFLQNGKPQMYRFAGGYASFDADTVNGYHYYIADYQGPRSKKEGLIILREKTNPLGEGKLIGDLSSNISDNPSVQKRFGGKELDRAYGLDLYDFEARQYDAIVPGFTSIDPLAEKTPSISPYAYCAGDPVNCVDPDGRKVVFNTYKGQNVELEAQFNKARAYLQTIGASEYLDRIVNDDSFEVMISMPTKAGKNLYRNRKDAFGQGSWNNGIIEWDPTIAVETDNGYIMAPVEGLNHEANHAVNDLGGDEKQHLNHKNKTKKGTDPIWDSAEEKEVCQNENKLAEKMGKLDALHPTTRTKYKVEEIKLYKVDSVTSSSTENNIKP